MRKLLASLSACGVLFVLYMALGGSSTASNPPPTTPNSLTDAELTEKLIQKMSTVDLDSLPAIEVERFSLPSAGIDVMRVRLEETYEVEGVGKDTVELTGWIAAKIDNARSAEGESEVA